MQWALRVAFLFSKENQGEVRSSLQFILVLKICFVFPGKKCHRYFKDILQSVCFLVSQRGKDGEKKQWERGDSVGDGKTSWNWVDFRDHLFSLPQSLNDWFSSFLFFTNSSSGIFTSVKSELRNRTSEYSDVSDSEDSGPDCTALVCSEPQALCVIWWDDEHPCRRRLITDFPKLISRLCSTESPVVLLCVHTIVCPVTFVSNFC